MKILRSLPFLLLFFTFLSLSAQSSRGFSYQAVARDALGSIQANTSLNIEFSILDAGQTQVYEEDHIGVLTNDFGLFSLILGEGNSSQNFASIDWSSGRHFVVVKLNGLPIDTTELAAVPYAKLATEMQVTDLTDVQIATLSNGDLLKWDGAVWTNAPDAVDDADADPINEIQNLSINGDSLSLSNGGGSVQLPILTYTAGAGIDITGTVVSNTGDIDSTDDITIGSAAGGDLSGSYPAPTVAAVQGRPISSSVPQDGQVLKWFGLANSWIPSPDDTGTPIWTQTGSDIYYNTGNVGIGNSSPSSPLSVLQTSGFQTTASIEHAGGFAAGQKIMELKVPAAASDDGQFLDLTQGGNSRASIDVDGDARFKTVKATENLSSTATPENGTVYANNLPIAYGYISSTGSILQNYGIASVSRPNPGEYEIMLRKTPVGFPVVIASSFGSSPDNEIITVASSANNAMVRVNIEESGTGSNSNFYFVVYGDTQ